MTHIKRTLNLIITDLQKSIWLILGLLIYCVISSLCFGEFCPMKILTGIPCPGCGMTRAVFLMLTGNFAESFAMHPLVLLWILIGLYFAICRYILDKKPRGAGVIAVILCILMIPVYIYRMQTLFPNHVPMVYTPTPLGDMILFVVEKLRT